MRPWLAVLLFSCEGAISLPGMQPFGPVGTTGDALCTSADLLEPGRVTLNRLNRYEYNATVRDLVGDTTQPANDFPADDFGRGFDSLGEVLAASPLLVDKWDGAAEALASALVDRELNAPQATQVSGDTMTASTGSAMGGGAWNLFSDGTLSANLSADSAGTYAVEVSAYEQAAGPDHAQMQLSIDGLAVQTFTVSATAASPGSYQVQRALTAGPHTLTVEFLNDYYQAPDDRNLVVQYVSLSRPGSTVGGGQAKLLVCDPSSGDGCVRTLLSTFGRKAWRRPLAAGEVDTLDGLVQLALAQGDDVRQGLKLAVEAVLMSPNFLYRPELGATDDVYPLSPHELATRLSYFLWGSMPDDALDALADNGTLNDNLEPQVRRMLADPKADGFVTQFAGSWLWSRAVADSPSLSDPLKAAAQAETLEFFRAFVNQDLSALDLLGAGFTFVNDPLAAHYGLPAPGSSTVTRVSVDGTQRGMLLGNASVLTVTSHSDRTSPVKRGKWVLSQLLCQTPKDPPPGVPPLPATMMSNLTLRQQMEEHRKNPICASCHAQMDPIGFGLENYDHVGRWRTTDFGGGAIDASGELPDGRTFNGPQELTGLLKADPRLPRCMTEQLFVFGLGRDVNTADRCAIDAAAQTFGDKGHRLSELVVALVKSPHFTTHRGEAP